MKTLLVPVDFDDPEHREASMKYAIYIAEKMNAKIILYNSITTPAFASNVAFEVIEIDDQEKKTIKQLNDLKQELTLNYPKIQFESYPTSSLRPIPEEIIDAAKEKNVDLIIMNTKGTNKLADIFISSNTIDVIMKSNIPVLVVPEHAPFQQISTIAFATDYHFSDKEAIKKLTDIAGLFDARVIVVHIQDNEISYEHEYNILDGFRAKVKEYITYPNLSFKLIKDENIHHGLDEFIKEFNVDILALASHQRGAMNRLFGSSVAKKFAYHTHIPLMVFRINNSD